MSSSTTTLILIRHGETDWNRELRFQGQIDVPLNATGRAQAERLGQRLAAGAFAIDAIVASDLLRTRETAAPAAQRLGLSVGLDAGLREQHFGRFEGLRAVDIQARHPEEWAAWTRHDPKHAPSGGESQHAFHARVIAALRRVAAAHAGRTLAVVTHGGVLDMLWRQAQGLPLGGARTCAIPNCGLNHASFDGASFRLLGWADDGHLHGLPEQPSTAPASA